MYNKLFAQILDSSVWVLPDPTRLVFITLMAAKDESGFARFGTLQNLADRARVSLEDCARAVDTLESPEPETATPEDDGRRIERVPGGWIVIKGPIYDQIASREQEKERVRKAVAEHRTRKRQANVTECNGRKQTVTRNNGSDADADTNPPTPRERGNGVSEGEEKHDLLSIEAIMATASIWGRQKHEISPTDWHLWREVAPMLTHDVVDSLRRYVKSREPRYRGTFSGFLRDPEKWIDRSRAHYPPKVQRAGAIAVQEQVTPLTDAQREQMKRDIQNIRKNVSKKPA